MRQATPTGGKQSREPSVMKKEEEPFKIKKGNYTQMLHTVCTYIEYPYMKYLIR